MRSRVKVLTEQHLQAAKRMPRKDCRWYRDKERQSYRRKAKRARKLIARFYRVLRSKPEEGDARLCHRHCVVVTESEAKLRLRHLEG